MVRLIQITNVDKWVTYVEQYLNARLTARRYLEEKFEVEEIGSNLTHITLFLTQYSATRSSSEESLMMTFTAFVKFHLSEENNNWTEVQGVLILGNVWIEF